MTQHALSKHGIHMTARFDTALKHPALWLASDLCQAITTFIERAAQVLIERMRSS